MTSLLLTGAGFSHNWGGWLANEVFEYLLGCREIDPNTRNILWRHKKAGKGFEEALAEIQEEYNRRRDEKTEKPLKILQSTLLGMFNQMDQAFARARFEPSSDNRYSIGHFMARFDAIFTLNQDLLLERHYQNDNNFILAPSHKWQGSYIPGMKALQNDFSGPTGAKAGHYISDLPNFEIRGAQQPYFKLHGSINWFDDANKELFIMGGNKALEINQHPVLTKYHQEFKNYLSRPDARLMIIGYSFSDNHINIAIIDAVKKGKLSLFIIDPLGVDVLNKQNPINTLRHSSLIEQLGRYIIGASRRPLTKTFSDDLVEHGKVMRFFATY